MYNAEMKLRYLNGTYKNQLKAIFNNSEPMERRLGDMSDWTTQDFAEYCARQRIFTSKNLSTFKSPIKIDYIKAMGKPTDEIDDLNLHLIYSKVQDLHIKVFWTDVNKLVRSIRNACEDGLNDRRLFTYNTVITASALMYCGIDFKDLPTIKRDDVVRNGIWSMDLPTKIPRQSIAAELIMQYAKQDTNLMEEYMTGLPLVRGGTAGHNALTDTSYRIYLTNANSALNRSPTDYDLTIQNIVISGELSRVYEKIGNTKNYDPAILQNIPNRQNVRIKKILDLQNLYLLYCMTYE